MNVVVSCFHLSPAWMRTPPFAWAVFSAIFCNTLLTQIKCHNFLESLIVTMEAVFSRDGDKITKRAEPVETTYNNFIGVSHVYSLSNYS